MPTTGPQARARHTPPPPGYCAPLLGGWVPKNAAERSDGRRLPALVPHPQVAHDWRAIGCPANSGATSMSQSQRKAVARIASIRAAYITKIWRFCTRHDRVRHAHVIDILRELRQAGVTPIAIQTELNHQNVPF